MFENARNIDGIYMEIDPIDLEALPPEQRAQVRIIDVRELHEWVGQLGHIEDATLSPLGQFLAEGPGEGVEEDDYLVLVCRSGRRSANAAMHMQAQGYERVFNLGGGMLAWNGAGFRVVRGG